MKDILDVLFIKNIEVKKYIFRNLYYSSDKNSFAGFNYDILIENKKYDSYEITKEILNNIGEYHKEYKAFIKLKDNEYFIRILKDNDLYCYDILMYKINNKNEYDKYNRIFFKNKIIIPDSLINIKYPLIFVDNHINLIKNEILFTKYLGYEDWDFKNKCSNFIDLSCESNIINDFKDNDFKKEYTFIKNGGDKIVLTLDIIYKDGFYYIRNIIK